MTRIAHFSDSHIGYAAYAAVSASGENQRSVDVARAFATVCQEIIEQDPPLVIHSGDLAERPHISIREMLFLRTWLTKLAGERHDGTRRQVVVISGNHDQPRSRKEACFLELYRGLPGVHIVTRGYEQITFAEAANVPSELSDVVVHCLPHDTLKDLAIEGEFGTVQPTADRTNVLVAHGVAGGSELYLRTLGREFTIPTEVLTRGWDYVALGHWHKQGPINVAGGRAWYAGSTENCGFGDLKENGTQRGWLDVTVSRGELPTVTPRHIPTRPMLRLPHLELDGKTPEEIVEALRANLAKVELNGAVVSQIVGGVSREMWSLVDLSRARAAASSALHYEVTPRYSKLEDGAEAASDGGLGDVDAVIVARAAAMFSDENAREEAVEAAKRYLAKALKEDLDSPAPASKDTETGAASAADIAETTTSHTESAAR